MTHEHIKALDELIAAVESGVVISMNARKVCHCLGWKFPDMRVKWLLSSEVGSLDAAKALHEALLPGWGYRVSPSYAIVIKPNISEKHLEFDAIINNNPARAWLIAILKAYRAKMEIKPNQNN